MKWVTWEQVGVDRIGCAWLIRRFIDPEAEFVFIPMGETTLPENMTAFDIPGAWLSHRKSRCTFSTMLQEYDLHDPVLQRIARIIDEADVVQDVGLEVDRRDNRASRQCRGAGWTTVDRPRRHEAHTRDRPHREQGQRRSCRGGQHRMQPTTGRQGGPRPGRGRIANISAGRGRV